MSEIIDNRMTFGDDAYFLSETLLQIPVASQHTWLLPRELPAAHLRRLHDRLLAGPLSRLVQPSAIPWARGRWVPAPASKQLRIDTEPITPQQRMHWCDQRLDDPIDSVTGPSWRLAATPVSDGSQLVSLVTRHSIADGGLILRAIDAAVGDDQFPTLPNDKANDHPVRRRDDLRDAGQQLTAAARAIRTAARTARDARGSGANSSPAKAVVPTRDPQTPMRGVPGSSYTPPFVALDFHSADWLRAASARGGTSNNLLMVFAAGLLVASGRLDEGDTVTVGLPVRRRGDDDWRSNALGNASVPVMLSPERYTDLGPVRAASKAEFIRAADPAQANVASQLEPVLRVLPAALLRRVAERMPISLVTCSNVGRMTEAGSGLGGPPALSMMCRGVHRNITPKLLRSAGGGVTAWLQEFGDRVTLTIESLDPDHVPDRAELLRQCTDEAKRWGLVPLSSW